MLRNRSLPLVIPALLLALAAAASGQFVHYPDDNTAPNAATPGGWYPWFTNVTGCRAQIRIPASAFTGITLPIQFTSIGFVLGVTVTGLPATYSQMQFRLGASGVPALTNNFANNLPPANAVLIVDIPGATFPSYPTAGQWVDIPLNTIFTYTGGDLILDGQSRILAGGTYHRSAVSSLVPRCINAAYTGTQTTGTLGASSGEKVRFGWIPAGPPQYQLNSAAASLTVNGVVGNILVPASPVLAINSVATAAFTSTNAGLPWDIGLGLAPLLSVAGGAISTADGDILNLDVTDPSFTLLLGGFLGGPFANLNLPYPTSSPLVLSAQFVILDPTTISSIRLSQATRVTVQ